MSEGTKKESHLKIFVTKGFKLESKVPTLESTEGNVCLFPTFFVEVQERCFGFWWLNWALFWVLLDEKKKK